MKRLQLRFMMMTLRILYLLVRVQDRIEVSPEMHSEYVHLTMDLGTELTKDY